MQPTIGVVGGTGAEGMGLAARFAKAGRRVLIGSRDAARAKQAAQRIGAEGMLNEAAVRKSDIVILTVPLTAQIATLKSLQSSFHQGAILVDTTVPLEAVIGGRFSHPLALWAGSAAEQAARNTPPGVSVVAAFHTLSAALLGDPEQAIDSDVLMCGDQVEAKAAVAELVTLLPGARAIDAGPLENARMVETAAALLISLNIRHKVKHSGLRIAGFPG
jgi:8-hydroxy-5-deazaflavin:NADPH oxidoreductase